jgi:DNA-binding NarL/FixJ family response regulator
MDCQMPEMDGFEATELIRRADSAVLDPQVTVIAMTANAMQGDRERCIACGMNDYIAKPVRAEALGAMLAKWLGGEDKMMGWGFGGDAQAPLLHPSPPNPSPSHYKYSSSHASSRAHASAAASGR